MNAFLIIVSCLKRITDSNIQRQIIVSPAGIPKIYLIQHPTVIIFQPGFP